MAKKHNYLRIKRAKKYKQLKLLEKKARYDSSDDILLSLNRLKQSLTRT